jgi:hypothetical protein
LDPANKLEAVVDVENQDPHAGCAFHLRAIRRGGIQVNGAAVSSAERAGSARKAESQREQEAVHGQKSASKASSLRDTSRIHARG